MLFIKKKPLKYNKIANINKFERCYLINKRLSFITDKNSLVNNQKTLRTISLFHRNI